MKNKFITRGLALWMIDEFEDNDDVQNVFHNLEMTDELAKSLESD